MRLPPGFGFSSDAQDNYAASAADTAQRSWSTSHKQGILAGLLTKNQEQGFPQPNGILILFAE
jgi:hypothetical protein